MWASTVVLTMRLRFVASVVFAGLAFNRTRAHAHAMQRTGVTLQEVYEQTKDGVRVCENVDGMRSLVGNTKLNSSHAMLQRVKAQCGVKSGCSAVISIGMHDARALCTHCRGVW